MHKITMIVFGCCMAIGFIISCIIFIKVTVDSSKIVTEDKVCCVQDCCPLDCKSSDTCPAYCCDGVSKHSCKSPCCNDEIYIRLPGS